MILTVTLNPSVDVSYYFDHLIIDGANTCEIVSKVPGGKGLNVAKVIHQLNQPVIATGIIGGSFGEFIDNELQKLNVKSSFYRTDKETRSCISILHDGNQTEIRERGNPLEQDDVQGFINLYEDLLSHDIGLVSMSGSMPPGMPKDIYNKLIDMAKKKGKMVVADLSGAPFDLLMEQGIKPYAIKPNQEEISALAGKPLLSDGEIVGFLKSQIFNGIELVLVSLGKDGAIVKYNDEFLRVKVPKIEAINPVGSGDSSVAGLCYGIDRGYSIDKIIAYAMTCGLLNALEEDIGKINTDRIEDVLSKIEIVRM